MGRFVDRKIERRKVGSSVGSSTMSQYKLVTYQSPQGPRAGLVVDDTVFDLVGATGRASYATMLDLLRDWDAARPVLQEAAGSAAKKTEGRPLTGTKLLPPVPTPAGSFC